VGLIVATDRVERIVPPKKGEKHVMRVIREILGFEHGKVAHDVPPEGNPLTLGARTDLRSALETLVGVARRRSVTFVISDFLAQGYERALSVAAAKHDVIPVTLVDRRDLELPDVGLATFQDLESQEVVVVDTADPKVRAHYAQAMRALANARQQLFRKLGLDEVVVETGGSFVKPLRDLFARRGRRAQR
jgi:uncharacterized protein (DUF58 family)